MNLHLLLIGHPNVGKSTLFNSWTGSQTSTGNRPGVTVHRRVHKLKSISMKAFVEDLPGIIYLERDFEHCAYDHQETLKRLADYQDHDVIVNIIDARGLRPQLHLTLELMELQRPMVILLTMNDQPHLARDLEEILGISVYDAQKFNPSMIDLQKANSIKKLPHLELANLESPLCSRLWHEEIFTELSQTPTWEKLKNQTENQDFWSMCSEIRYHFIDQFLQRSQNRHRQDLHSHHPLDQIALHRLWGFPLFFSIMFFVFWGTVVWGEMITQWLTPVLHLGLSWVAHLWSKYLPLSPLIHDLAEGLSLGLETSVSFIGPIGMLYLLLNLLEETGYMQRAALVIDRVMQTLRLPGQSFVPIVVGLGCNVPAILSARTLSHPIDRLQSMLMTPFMSCSARLAIFTVFAQSFFGEKAYLAIFQLYLLGFIIAIFTGLMIRLLAQSHEHTPLIEQLVPYQWPQIETILKKTSYRLTDFLSKAILWILPAIVVIHILMQQNWAHLSSSQQSQIVWAFRPLGLTENDAGAVLALFSGLIAKEVLLGTLEGFYSQTHASASMTIAFANPHAAMSYLIFILLYFPCISVTVAIAQETRLFWAVFAGLWSTLIAYIAAMLYYQWATLTRPLIELLLLTFGSFGILFCFLWIVKVMIERKQLLILQKKPIPFHLK